LLKEYPNPQDVLAEDGLLKQLTKAVIERCLETELDTHLGYAKHGRQGNAAGNTRNGTSPKTVKGEQGQIEIEVPRDRQGTFEPQLVKKGQTGLEGFDEKILALDARGMTTRDIQAQLQDLYGVEVSPALISNVTEAVMEEVQKTVKPPIGSGVPDRLSRLPGRQSQGESARKPQSGVFGVGSHLEREQGEASDVALGQRGG
jgi:putative transposase